MTVEKPKVLVDMDGVLGDWTGMFETLLRRDYPHIEILPREQITQFHMEDLYPQEHRADIMQMMHTPGFYRDLTPIDGAVEGVKALAAQGYDVFFCSSPFLTHSTCASEKIEWIGVHFGEEWTNRIILTSDKTMVHGDVLIDDKETITGVNIPTWKHFVFDDTHNQNSEAPVRVHDWKETVFYVSMYLEGKRARQLEEEYDRRQSNGQKRIGFSAS